MRYRNLQFDLIRSVAILAVLIYHLPGYSFDFFDLSKLGISIDSFVLRELSKYFGLGLFIFASGHLANLKGRRFSDMHTIKEYVLTKIIRIFPLYYVALFAICHIYDIHEPTRLIAHLLGVQLILASQLIKPVPTLWFIGLILIYYGAYMIYRAEKLNPMIKMFILAVFPLAVLFVNRTFQIMDLRLVLYYGIFLLGLYSGGHALFNRISWRQTVIASLAFAFLVIIYGGSFTAKPFASLGSFLMVNLLMFLFIDFTYKGCLLLTDKISYARPIEIISYSSFCMFLFHRPIWSTMHKFLRTTALINSDSMMAIVLAAVGIPLIIAVSYSIQQLYDRIVLAR